MGTYIKILHILISLIAALTVGVLLSLFIGIASLIDSFFKFPLQVYRNLEEQERLRRLSQLFTPHHNGTPVEPLDDDIWERHIRRMEEKKKKNEKLKQQIEACSPYNDGWTKEFHQKQIDKDE